MPETRIDAAVTTSMDAKDQTAETVSDFRRTISVSEQDQPGTRYYPDWAKWFGYYKNVPELQAVINKKAIWTLGKGYEAEKKTKDILEKIRGCGKDTFNSIMFNNIIAYTAGGDSFCEIVKNARGVITNLKPMNPGSMVIESNEFGIITRYGQAIIPQRDGSSVQKGYYKYFKPKDIFHLPWNRLGDECHGRSTVEKLQWIIDAKNEAQKDIRIIFHRYVKPLIVSMVDTDDTTEIATLKAKLDNAVENMENLVIPKGTVEMERMSIPQYSTLDPLPWIQLLQTYFIMSEGVPEVVLGYGRETTEASAKILYLAFQQNIEHNQIFIEDNMKAQLGLDVEFNFPENIGPELEEDAGKARRMDNFEMKGGGDYGRKPNAAGRGTTAGRKDRGS